MPCLGEEGTMAGLLLVGLLVCTPLVAAQPLATIIISELCYYNVDVRYLVEQMSPIRLNILPREGKHNMCRYILNSNLYSLGSLLLMLIAEIVT